MLNRIRKGKGVAMKTKQFVAIFLALAVGSGMSASAKDAVYVWEDSQKAVVNGMETELEDKVLNVDGKMYLPLREFARLFGLNVYWKDRTAAVGEQNEQVLSDMYSAEYIDSKLKGGTPADLSDIRKIKDRLKESLLNKNADPSEALTKWKEDGSFDGVEYFNPDKTVWTANLHADYLRTMVKAAYSEGNEFYGDADLKQKIAKSLEFWAKGGRVECDNWWYQQIGIPNILVDILTINPEEISDEIRAVLNSETAQGSIFNETDLPDRITERPVSSTGGNLTDKLVTSFKIAIATEDESALYDILHLLENELRIFPAVRTDEFGEDAEGIKADYSFHQHVDQVQFGGYGAVFTNGVCTILENIKDTKYMLADHALNEFANFILDGMQWVFRNDYQEFTTAGRSITRPNNSKGIRSVVKRAVEAMEGITQIDRYDELMALKENRLGETDVFTGNKQFWLSDYMSHNRDGFHVGIKLASNRAKLGEVINDENMLGYYLSDGVTSLMQRGDEYDGIFPVWNWNRLPGTTTPQGGLKNLNDWAEWNGEHLWNWKGNNSFVGGVSDGKYGAAVMDYTRDGMDAHKAWFLFDDQMIALGNSIHSYTDMDIYTNINQCILNGDVVISENGTYRNAAEGQTTIKDADYILHDGIGYQVEGDAELNIGERTASWGTINGGYKDQEETKNVFELGIRHGVKPNNASYIYRTVFGADETKMNALSADPAITVLRNDDKVQAVYDRMNKITQAIVWKMDTIQIPGGLTVTVNKKCALIIKELADGGLEITASNPTNEPKDLQVTVNKALMYKGDNVVTGDGSATLKFRLNEGIYGGSSTTFHSDSGFSEFLN